MNDLVKHFKFLYNVCTTPSADRRLKAFLCCLCTHVTPPIAPAPTTALGSAASVPSGFGEHSTESSSVEARRREVGNTLKSSDAILSGCRPRLRLHPPRSRTQSLPRLNSFRNSLPFMLSRNPKFRFFLHRRSESRLSFAVEKYLADAKSQDLEKSPLSKLENIFRKQFLCSRNLKALGVQRKHHSTTI
jgi:hypothetical protein